MKLPPRNSSSLRTARRARRSRQASAASGRSLRRSSTTPACTTIGRSPRINPDDVTEIDRDLKLNGRIDARRAGSSSGARHCSPRNKPSDGSNCLPFSAQISAPLVCMNSNANGQRRTKSKWPHITASLVKDLREKTGAGMMDCKTALTEIEGDIEAAIDWLRKKGLSKAAKKAGRVAAEGLVAVTVHGMSGVVVEVNSRPISSPATRISKSSCARSSPLGGEGRCRCRIAQGSALSRRRHGRRGHLERDRHYRRKHDAASCGNCRSHPA